MADPLGFLQSVLNGTMNGATEAGEGLVKGAVDAFNLPRDVYAGKVQTDPRYMSDEEFQRTLNLAGNVAGGGITVGAAPEGAIGMFAGRKSQTFPSRKLQEFLGTDRSKPGSGVVEDNLYADTGIFRGKDGGYRYEISDNEARPLSRYLMRVEAGGVDNIPVALRDVIEHPQLFDAYPELGDMAVIHSPGMKGAGFYRYPNDTKPPFIKMDMTGAGTQATGGPMSTLLHEVQHGVQKIEGFAPGSNPADPEIALSSPVLAFRGRADAAKNAGNSALASAYKQSADAEAWKAYSREAGEVEARAVQRRMDYTQAERREIHPIKEENYPALAGPYAVPIEQQWVGGKSLPYPVETYDPNLPFLAQYLGK